MDRLSGWARNDTLVPFGVLAVLAGAVWTAVGLAHHYPHPIIGWLPLPVGVILAGRACWLASRAADVDDGTRRFWRHLTVACVLFLGGIVANVVDAVGGPEPSQRVGAITLAWYLAVLAVTLWALLRLPSWQRTRSDWLRFSLDTCIVLVATSVFVWHFSLREHERWMSQTGSAGAMLAIVAVGVISVVTFVKVAFAGAGQLDRRAVQVLAAGSALSTLVGGMSPFLTSFPYLSSSLVAVPVATLSIQLAATAQRRKVGSPPRERRRSLRINVIPYLAVAAMDALLLSTPSADPAENDIMKVSAVALTMLVIARQIIVLRDNRCLLAAVDAHVADLNRYQGELTHQATHDHLTGVANRVLLDSHLDQLLRAGTAVHVALLDIDDFKTINDRHGHRTGDRLLAAVSSRLTATVGAAGLVARLGGDEFALVLAEPDPERVREILGRVLVALRANSAPVRSVASVGATTSRPGDTPEELLRRADVAMYAAKALGGDRLHWFDPAMDELAAESARLGSDLEQALRRGEMFLLYQPIVELPSHRPAGVEALLRWRHPDRGLVSPDVFIPIAERSGLILELGRWVLESACRQAALWQQRYGTDAPAKVSINVSARQLAEPGFVAEVEDILRRTGVDRSRLLLEITETAVLDPGPALAAVRELRDRKLRIALDDFGTGQSSLSLLLHCPVDVLKVDKSFVSGTAATSDAGAVIVENLIGFTTGLHLEAVAEGVETAEQAERLSAAGYRLAQGYLFSRPVPAEIIEAQLTGVLAKR
ncbi:bifunctional diguanylate cyclase/phosphodiesterase [Paractinoplanes ferrugineus]|uniref:Diguanylate cyclase (GGDEF)-like protein n=1 Tax=Paractinoplanes ferrugineus TaxID=113564 RepID=A0A919J011_9ACTN|nr:bifunctional diguanylate cyclase/phosphodiesterase [Actinoplanes ferrugineus]GIE11555.1 hypothetical protein Afe05nite_33950 [Actinoplanes ferrugineus]